MTDETDAATDGGSDSPGGAGSAPPQSGADDESIVDLAQQPVVKAWTKFVAALFALIGFGIGLALILLDVVDEMMFEADGPGAMAVSFMALPSYQAIFWSLLLGAAVGVYVGWSLVTDDTTTMLVAAISTFVGTIVLLVLSAFLTTVAMDGISVDFGGLLITSIVAGIAVAVVAAGSVWIVRNQSPADHASDA